jgi:hypothetical protein
MLCYFWNVELFAYHRLFFGICIDGAVEVEAALLFKELNLTT